MKKIVAARMPIQNKNALVTVLYEDGKPKECFVRAEEQEAQEGSIFTGLVEKVDSNLNAAFVRIGKDISGYLPLKKAKDAVFCGMKRTDGLKAQDQILVMVEKAAVKTKHCVLTCELSVSGKYLVVYAGKNGRAGFSNKLKAADRDRLKEIDNMMPHSYDLTFRTLSAEADPEEIAEEYERLKAAMDRITGYGISRPYGTCLYQGSSPEEQILKRIPGTELDGVVTDSPQQYEELLGNLCPVLNIGSDKIRFYEDPMIDLYKLYNLSTLLDRITGKKVPLRSGANLLIEETEAFTVIDVNSAGSSKKYKNAGSFLPVNLEAAAEIAAQMRLRQLSGILLIDFISMDSGEEEEELIRAFRELVKDDPVRTSVVDITKLGIMEVTREKRYRNLNEQLREVRNTL